MTANDAARGGVAREGANMEKIEAGPRKIVLGDPVP
jgi:hypothetical protein